MKLMNESPDGQHMKKLVQRMRKIYLENYPEGELNMDEIEVNNGSHICGTVHCAGGWDAVLLLPHVFKMNYEDGADLFAEKIGFRSLFHIEIWADENPLIWGNTEGGCMFSSKNAYTSPRRPDGAESYLDVLDHREEVADRLIELQKN